MFSNDEFNTFLATLNTSKGNATFNLNTRNVSRMARDILKKEYPALAKQHINAGIINAYISNSKFKNTLDAKMAELDIQVIAPAGK